MLNPSELDLARLAFNNLADSIYAANVKAGWYKDPRTGRKIDRNVAEMLALCHSELSEGLEGWRKKLPDDKLPEFPMIIVELADTMIRVLDLAGYLRAEKLDAAEWGNTRLGDAFASKVIYNGLRADHKLENRAKPGGKAI